MPQLDTPFGCLELNRYPLLKRETLRAWDAADEYLLSELTELGGQVLILNDQFGALSCALSGSQPVMQSDSYTAMNSTRQNLSANGLSQDSVIFADTLQPHHGQFDLVIVRVTKALALLEDELKRLRPHLTEKTRIIGLGMVKQIHSSTLALFEQIIGPTRTSLARKKARLIHAAYDPDLSPDPSPYPALQNIPEYGYTTCNHANVFSRGRLDIGTRFFIQQIPQTEGELDIVDLGCGNGIVGVLAGSKNPLARLHFTDESYMAVASAKQTFNGAGLGNEADFTVGDCLSEYLPESMDLILCNPPFHQQQVVGDAVAWRMFSQACKVLKPGGELLVIGNRHLGYHSKLKRIFGNQQQLACNKKFVVLASRKPEA